MKTAKGMPVAVAYALVRAASRLLSTHPFPFQHTDVSPRVATRHARVRAPQGPFAHYASGHQLLRVAPVVTHAGIDKQRHFQPPRAFHFLLHHLSQGFGLLRRRFKYEFVVHLQ